MCGNLSSTPVCRTDTMAENVTIVTNLESPGNELCLLASFGPFPPLCGPCVRLCVDCVVVVVPLRWRQTAGGQGTAGTAHWCQCSLPRRFSPCLPVPRPRSRCETMCPVIVHRFHAPAACCETRNHPNKGWWSLISSGFLHGNPVSCPCVSCFRWKTIVIMS